MKILSCLNLFLVLFVMEFHNNHLIDARRHHHRQGNFRRIHASYEPWLSDGNGDGGGGSLSPWELSLMSEILTEFGISECPAIDASGFDEFREYLSEPISRARESRIINDRFTQVYDSLNYCLGSEPSEIDWQDQSGSEETDGQSGAGSEEGYQQQSSEEGEDSELDISTTTQGTQEDNASSLSTSATEQEEESTSHRSNEDLESSDEPEAFTSEEGSSTVPTDLDATEVLDTDSDEIGLLKRAVQIGLEIIKKVEDLFLYVGPERRGAKQSVEYLGTNPVGSSTEESTDLLEQQPDAISYHYALVPRPLVGPIVNNTKAHFSEVFEGTTMLVFDKCPALEEDRGFIQDAVFKILTLIYEDLERAAESDEILNVNKELLLKLRDCTNSDK